MTNRPRVVIRMGRLICKLCFERDGIVSRAVVEHLHQ
jgi:hypothetical protein